MKKITSCLCMALLLLSCENNPSSANKENASVALAVRYTAQPSALARLKKAGKFAGMDSISIESARFLIRNVRMKTIIEDSVEFLSDPFVVNLDLKEKENSIIIKDVPVGTYNRLEFRIHRLDDDDPQDKAYFLHPDFLDFVQGNRFSIIIEGRIYDGSDQSGSPFVFRSRDNEKQKHDLNPALSIDADSGIISVVMVIDGSGWFIGKQGEILDPRAASSENEISENLRLSIKIEKSSFKSSDDRNDY